ncbi:MAG: hypothetical protein OXC31_08300, partial [Spirochaetaceae bacterium]|nr:hypothetical protein [Spirochaetaceae bacterium]
MARPETRGFAVGVTAPFGFRPAAARRSVAGCRFGAGAELGVGCAGSSGVGVGAAGITASCTVT